MQQPQVEEKRTVRKRRLSVVKIQMLKEKTFPYNTNKITDPTSAVRLLEEFIGKEDREHFVLICLDTKNKVTAINTVSIGSLNSAIVVQGKFLKRLFWLTVPALSWGIIIQVAIQ
nr:JAB domain-containing protein [Bacillus sp. FJAT-45350]